MDTLKPLADMGIVPVTPLVHSSDAKTCLNDPFKFFLTRRLGLHPVKSYYPAFNLGQWTHILFQYQLPGGTDFCTGSVAKELVERKNKIKTDLSACGIIDGETLWDRQAQEEEDYKVARAWWGAATQVIMPKIGTFTDFFAQPHWVLLDSEVDIVFGRSTIRIDRLYYNKIKNTLVNVDLKTCSENPWIRAQKCKVEFQPKLYGDVLECTIDDLIAKYHLPLDVMYGGTIHLILQKPTIKFGAKDRPYFYEAIGIRSKKKAIARLRVDNLWHILAGDIGSDQDFPQICEVSKEDDVPEILRDIAKKKPEKIYSGEPSVELFTKRCKQWYSDIQTVDPELAADIPQCPINMSSIGRMDTQDRLAYYTLRKIIDNYIHCKPKLENFPMNPDGMGSHGHLNVWADFYVTPLEKWPDIINRGHFIIEHRDSLSRNSIEIN